MSGLCKGKSDAGRLPLNITDEMHGQRWNLTVSIDVESRWHVVVAMEIDVSNA